MTDSTQNPQKAETRSEVVLRKLQGKIALEKYPDGYVVTLRGKKEIIWVRFEDLKQVVLEFEEVITIKDKKV